MYDIYTIFYCFHSFPLIESYTDVANVFVVFQKINQSENIFLSDTTLLNWKQCHQNDEKDLQCSVAAFHLKNITNKMPISSLMMPIIVSFLLPLKNIIIFSHASYTRFWIYNSNIYICGISSSISFFLLNGYSLI